VCHLLLKVRTFLCAVLLRDVSLGIGSQRPALQGRLLEVSASQAGIHQCADIAVVVAARGGQHAAVMFAKALQRLFQAQAFEQRQAQGK
jgi:hypothetical protein